jgi:hypothetical protein
MPNHSHHALLSSGKRKPSDEDSDPKGEKTYDENFMERFSKKHGHKQQEMHSPAMYQAGDFGRLLDALSNLVTLLQIPLYVVTTYATKLGMQFLGHGAGCLAVLFFAFGAYEQAKSKGQTPTVKGCFKEAVAQYKETAYAQKLTDITEFVGHQVGFAACVVAGIGVFGDLPHYINDRVADYPDESVNERVAWLVPTALNMASSRSNAQPEMTDNERQQAMARPAPRPIGAK